MDLNDALDHALDGESILFIGAGFSVGATNVAGREMMLGSQLAEHYAAQLGLPPDTALGDASEEFAHARGEDALIADLKQQFQASETQDYHRRIVSVPWLRIYTTNYDDVAERAARDDKKSLTPVTAGTGIYGMPKDLSLCVHLNGFIDSLNRDTLWDEFKLVDSSYLTATLEDSPWMMLFRQDLRIARSVFFVGYSVQDLDIGRLLSSSDLLREKCFFVLGNSPSAATLRRASRFGAICTESSAAFALRIESTKATHKKPSRGLQILALEEYRPSSSPEKGHDPDFINLLLFGDLKDGLVQSSMASDNTYYLERERTSTVLDLIEPGKIAVAVTADLGNGKTLLLSGLRQRAYEAGYRVFDLAEKNQRTLEELESLTRHSDKMLLIADNYVEWLDEIRFFCLRAHSRCSLVATARSALHDLLEEELDNATGDFIMMDVSVDQLADDEIEWVQNSLDVHGLWGDNAGLTRGEKRRFLVKDCNAEFHAILLGALEAPAMKDRLADLYGRLKAKTSASRVLTGALVLTVLGKLHGIDTLIDIFGADAVLKSSLRKDPAAAELIDITSGRVRVRSAVVARYLLRGTIPPSQTVECLKHLCVKANSFAHHSQRYWSLMVDLTRYALVQNLLPEKGKRSAVIDYYEGIKGLQATKHNYLFWLQYAIACLVNDELERSKKYFDTSYALARKRDKDTYQIDNHYSRYLLRAAIEGASPDDHMLCFRQARNIIHRQIHDVENRHYPYKVARTYQDFYDRFEREFSSDDLNTIAGSASSILNRIAALPEERRKHRYVRECVDSMDYVLARVEESRQRLGKQNE